MANDDAALSARVRWARLRFQILGPVMAAPAEDGELKARLDALAAPTTRSPLSLAKCRRTPAPTRVSDLCLSRRS